MKLRDMIEHAFDLSKEYIFWRSHIIEEFRSCFLPLIPARYRGVVAIEFDKVRDELWP